MMRSVLFIALLSLFALSGSGQTSVDFRSYVEKRLATKKLDLATICPIDSNVVARRVFKDYGAMFVATWDVQYPDKCVFGSEEEVAAFQSRIKTKTLTIGNRTIELQAAAMDELIKARAAAAKRKLTITPRGATAAKRGYADTLRIWMSRFEPALRHWVARGRIKAEDAETARKMGTIDQVAAVIEWEKDSIWFSTGFNRSIFSSVAAPGTSQHLSMLALDVAEFTNRDVRAILNQHGWFQTIIDDTPHFTYLGLEEKELPKRGLIAETRGGFTFWIPNFER
jgi:hypothetical protein